MSDSLFWYDYETTGINPRCDRPLQVAGIRTSLELDEIEAPVNLYCQLSADILPHPAACLITGISPQLLAEKGLPEYQFVQRIQQELARPGTCSAGYNTLRFDDEVTRFSFWRNFHDPYAREWQNGNSRWDLIDLVRACCALRPDGLEWPQVDGRPSLKLELLTAANGIAHESAHDALSDVRATIALARLVRQRQPKLYDWCFALRRKDRVLDLVRLLEPMLHVSGRFSAAHSYLSVVLPLAWHPVNRNALIVCDLQHDISPLLELPAEELRKRLYTRREELGDLLPVPLKLIQINRSPVIAPLNTLRPQDRERLQIDLTLCQQRAEQLRSNTQWQQSLAQLYAQENFAGSSDPEQQLYDGFVSSTERNICRQVLASNPQQLATLQDRFTDNRLRELLLRYRARNFPASLSAEEQLQWAQFCKQRLHEAQAGAPITLAQFNESVDSLLATCTAPQQQLLQLWQQYARQQDNPAASLPA